MQKKVEGQEITDGRRAADGGAQVIDLMEALRASLEKKAPRAAPRGEAYRKPPKRAAHGRTRRRARPPRNSSVATVPMHQYGVRDVEKLLRLPRSTIRGADRRPASSRPRAVRAARGGSRSRT